jgi:iron complex outermembrane recepter protein
MHAVRSIILCCTALTAVPALAENTADESEGRTDIVVTAARQASGAATKTDTPAIETPQPVTIVTDAQFTTQGAISVSDTLRYVAGVQANPYGPDSRVDGAKVRGVDALQFRDGMRDIYSYYASIRADPYNFSQIQLIRGPSSSLFGSGALGGLLNLQSKLPEFTARGEVSLRYGSFDRKEAMADLTGPLGETVAARIVARVRDSSSQTEHVPDDRVMIAPSLTWAPSDAARLTLLGLYQEDDGGSTSQFLPIVGTILPNPNGRLANDQFIGKPGWDRYDGRLLQGTALFEQSFGEAVRLSLKARYIDSDLTYLTHYPDSYGNPRNPYVIPGAFDIDGNPVTDPLQRTIGLYSDGNRARMEVFSTDNNLRFDFETGSSVQHVLLAGVDYNWNRVRKVGGYGYEYIDIYNIDYEALSNYGGGLPQPASPQDDTRQEQLGFYLQDQIRIADRVSVVLGVRHDRTRSSAFGGPAQKDHATTFRAGVIGEIVHGVSPFVSYTESFEPVSGSNRFGPYKPQQGRQYEAGVKFQPNDETLVTLTAYHIKQTNGLVNDTSAGASPFDQIQTGEVVSKGIEVEASATLPGKLQILANFSYNDAKQTKTTDPIALGRPLDNVPKYNASLWATRPFDLGQGVELLLGGGVRYSGANWSYGTAFPDGLRTPAYTLVDALAKLTRGNWSLAVNATNLLGKRFYSACLARGDCFVGEARNVFGTLSYSF